MKNSKLFCFLFLALVLCVCLLPGCGRENQVFGEVIEAQFDENNTLVSLIVKDLNGEDSGVFITGETPILSLIDGVTADEFQTEHPIGTIVSAPYSRRKQTMITESGEEMTFYWADYISIRGVIRREVEVLSDGTLVDRVEEVFDSAYRLADGTELLRVHDPIGPENTSVGGLESYDDLSTAAREKVLAYYQEQGLLYDLHEELEKAYASYRASGSNEDFEPHLVEQEVVPSAYNEQIIYFLTSVTLPIDGNHMYELRIGAAFDKKTGEHIDNRDLFNCSEDEAMQVLLDAACAWTDDSTLRAEMAAVFRPEQIVMEPDGMEISFPPGTLPNQEYTYIAVIDLDDSLLNILHEWAVPVGRE